jgi:hypothetical protein
MCALATLLAADFKTSGLNWITVWGILNGGYGFFNWLELFADAFDGFLVTHWSLVPSSSP